MGVCACMNRRGLCGLPRNSAIPVVLTVAVCFVFWSLAPSSCSGWLANPALRRPPGRFGGTHRTRRAPAPATPPAAAPWGKVSGPAAAGAFSSHRCVGSSKRSEPHDRLCHFENICYAGNFTWTYYYDDRPRKLLSRAPSSGESSAGRPLLARRVPPPMLSTPRRAHFEEDTFATRVEDHRPRSPDRR